MKVADFRNQVDAALDCITNYNGRVGKGEKVAWFVAAIQRFESLSPITCKRANAEDLEWKEKAQTRFTDRCQANTLYWLDARLELGLITEDAHRTVSSIERALLKNTPANDG